MFRTERSHSRKIDNTYNQQKLSQNSKWNISDINKIQNLISNIRSSRSNKISKAGTDGINKPFAYKYDASVFKSTIEPKGYKYGISNANVNTINHQDFNDFNSITATEYNKSKGFKKLNGGRQILKQLSNKLRNNKNFKALYASNEVIKDSKASKIDAISSFSPKIPTKVGIDSNSLKQYQKEMTMIAKKKREYIFSQAKKLNIAKLNNLGVKQSHINHPNENTTTSIMTSMGGNPNNFSIDYPGLNESLITSHNDFDKAKIADYSTINNKKQTSKRNSTKKILRDINADVRQKHNGSVDKHKPYEYRSSIESNRKEGSKKNNHGDSMAPRSSCSNSNFTK